MKFLESETTELKRTLNKDFAKEVVAFLNTRDGVIYIGVDDNGKVLGVPNIDKTMREVRDIIRDQILPSTEGLCEIGSLLEGDKMVVSVKVSKGTKLYYIKKEGRSATGCFYRDGTSSTPMSEEEIDKRQIASLHEVKLSLVDIQSNGGDYTFDILKIKLRSAGVDINEKTFERSFRLLTKEGKYNLLAELLADKNFYSIQVCGFNGNDKLSYSKRNNFGQQSILQVYEDIKHYCEALNDTYIDDSSLPRRKKKMFDNEAFEEAWVNALIHNDWIHGNPPSIYWYQDRMEIMSYGGLKEGLSKEDFFDGVSDPVNKDLMDVFVQCDIVDRSGHGVPKVVKAYGREAFRFLGVGIMVTIPFDKKGFISKADGTINGTINDKENDTINGEASDTISGTKSSKTLSEAEKLIMYAISLNGRLTRKEMSGQTNLSERTVSRILASLQDKGLIVRVGSRKKGEWKTRTK